MSSGIFLGSLWNLVYFSKNNYSATMSLCTPWSGALNCLLTLIKDERFLSPEEKTTRKLRPSSMIFKEHKGNLLSKHIPDITCDRSLAFIKGITDYLPNAAPF